MPFVIIGHRAVNFHSYVRTTEDADIWFDHTAASEAALLQFLQSIRVCWISDERNPQSGLERQIAVSVAYVRMEPLMMLWTDLGFLDIYDLVPGLSDTVV